MKNSTIEKFEKAQQLIQEAMSLLEEIRPHLNKSFDNPSTQKKLDEKIKMLLHSNKWPLAIEESRICDTNCDEDKITRALAILDQIIDVDINNKKLLDFGCGEGHVSYMSTKFSPEISIGYDIIRQGWGQFPKNTAILTSDISIVNKNAPYDIILLHDVLDHVEDPIDVLQTCRKLLSNNGRMCVKCHPYCSKHGGHTYHTLNRAYSQFFLPNNLPQKILRPLQEYQKWFVYSGFNIIHQKPNYNEVPILFSTTSSLSNIIKSIYESDEFPYQHLMIESINYSLSPALNTKIF